MTKSSTTSSLGREPAKSVDRGSAFCHPACSRTSRRTTYAHVTPLTPAPTGARAALTCVELAGTRPLDRPATMTAQFLGSFNLEHIDQDFGPFLLLRAHVSQQHTHL